MKGTDKHADQARPDNLEELFQHVSARERPPQEDEEAIREALRAQWSSQTRQRQSRRRVISWAAAASVLLAVFVGYKLVPGPGPVAPAQQLATIEKITGMALLRSSGNESDRVLSASGTLDPGQTIATRADSRIAIRWLNGESIRLDQNSELRLNSSGEIDLLTGRIYLDTDAAAPAAELVIVTPQGRVRHLGTRYMTSVGVRGVSVSVREGRVQLEAQNHETVAGQGEQLTVDEDGAQSLDSIPTYGPDWQWMEEVAPTFSSNGRSMADFLQWVARESGRVVEYASAQAQSLAKDTVLHGDVGMEPMRALSVMMQTSDLASEIHAGVIVVRLNSEG